MAAPDKGRAAATARAQEPAEALSLKLIVGLGNPGPEYAATRHNAGWWFVEALAARYGGRWRHEGRWQADLTRVRIESDEIWLLKPVTYMNRSGGPAAAAAGFYRISPQQVLVAHDDIDLPPGTARFKYGGGHGGHNGLRDVIAHLGADFWRLRFGVGHPGRRELVIDAVLDRPSAEEEQLIETALERALGALVTMLREGPQKAMNQLHHVAGSEPGSEGGGPDAS